MYLADHKDEYLIKTELAMCVVVKTYTF